MKRSCLAWILMVIAATALAAEPAAPVILVFGDSISAGYGIRVERGWVALLQRRLREQGYGYRVVNASVSGETTDGGLARLPRALEVHRPAIVVLELGANDGLRALPLERMRDNLGKMIELSRAAHAKVVLVGMRIPPNYGPTYTQGFAAVYDALSQRKDVARVPFLMRDVALDGALLQADQIHPNELGQPHLLGAVWPVLVPLLARR